MSSRPTPSMSPAVLSDFCRRANDRARSAQSERAVQPAENDVTSDPRLRGAPYTVDLVPSLRGTVTLIGYDGRGEVMVEFRVPSKRYSRKMADRLVRWMRENDDSRPALTVIL